MTETGDRMRAEEARRKLQVTLAEVQARLAPKALARDAAEGVMAKGTMLAEEVVAKGSALADQGVATAKARPGVAAAALGGALLILLRRPIWRALRGKRRVEAETTDE